MQKKFNKEPFRYTGYEFDNLSEIDRLCRIHTHPAKFKRAMENRRDIIKENLHLICDGYSKSDLESVGGSKGSKSDPTANAVINALTYLRLSEEEDNLDELMKLNEEQMPKELKSFLILKRSMYLYKKLITLFDSDVTKVLQHRMNGMNNEKIAEILEKSPTYVGEKITKSYEEILDRAHEVVNLYFYGTGTDVCR